MQELSWKLVTVADQADIIVATQSLATDSDGDDSGPLDPNADSPEQLEAITAFLDAPRKPAALSTLEVRLSGKAGLCAAHLASWCLLQRPCQGMPRQKIQRMAMHVEVSSLWPSCLNAQGSKDDVFQQ